MSDLEKRNRDLLDEFTVVYQQHLEEAKRCNFTACGCEWCEAYRKAVGND